MTARRRLCGQMGRRSLHDDPTQLELAAKLDVPAPLLDPDQRTLELRNWIESLR